MKIAVQFEGISRSFFWFLVGAALLVRLWGIWYGLPYSYWVDEYHEVLRALELGSGGFNMGRSTKGGLYLLLFFEYGLYYIVLKLAGIVDTTTDFARLFVADPTVFYILGRATGAIFGGLTIFAIYALGRRAYSPIAGLLAAIFLAVNVLHIDLSHRIGVDVPMTFFATIALYFGVKISTNGTKSDYLLAALSAALATTTKLPGILLLLPLLIAHTYAIAQVGGGLRAWFGSRHLWIACGLFMLVWVATDPGIIGMTGLVSFESGHSANSSDDGALDDADDAVIRERPNLYLYYLGVLSAAMGWPLYIVGLLSIAYALWKRSPPDVMLLSYALLNYLVFAGTWSDTLYYPRYALPIIVVITVLASRIVAELAGRAGRPAIAIALTAIVCISWPVSRSIANAATLTHTDTRTVAKEWIEKNIPVGSHILIEGIKIAPDKGTVQLRETPDAIRRRIEYWREREPKQARYLEVQSAIPGGVGYELHFVKLGSIDTLKNYALQGVEYFVIRPDYFEGSRRADAGAGQLVEELRSNPKIKLLRRIIGDTQTPPGPTIEIYGFR